MEKEKEIKEKGVENKVTFVGDVHGSFSELNKIINREKPSTYIICGDHAYYWINDKNEGKIKAGRNKVYLVPGNHEDWDKLDSIGRHGKDPIELEKNIYHCPIGSSIEIKGKKILFIGGGDSIDKESRYEGISWFRQEVLNLKDFDYIAGNNDNADIIVSHTCPKEFDMKGTGRYDKMSDPTRKVLSSVLKRLKPKFWFFGHWHEFVQSSYEDTTWTALNHIHQYEEGQIKIMNVDIDKMKIIY